MKSLAELQAIRDRAKMAVNVRENSEAKTRVLVGMATCGIAAGARPVLTTISDEVNKRELHDVLVTQTGCIGICQFEPIVEVIDETWHQDYIRKNDTGKGAARRQRSHRQRQCRHGIHHRCKSEIRR